MANYQPRPLRPDQLTVVGYRPYDMTTEDGRRNRGVSVYFLCDDPNGNVSGQMAGKISFSQAVLDSSGLSLSIGQMLDIHYDGNGKIKGIFQAI